MSKKKTEISPIRAERLKILVKKEGLTQKAFAEMVSYPQQGISQIINMKAPLTEGLAQAIVQKLPQYRLEWLLGYDDYITNSEVFSHVCKQAENQHDTMIQIIAFLAALKKIDLRLYASGFIHADGSVQDDFIVRTTDNCNGFITFHDLEGLIKDLAAITESQLLRIMRKDDGK